MTAGNDIALVWNARAGAGDLSLVDNDFATELGLRTAIILSLFTDRRAEDSDILPDGETDRRGWWADEFADNPGDLFGSRLWLLARSKREATVLTRAVDYSREALRWLLEDRVAASLDVTAEFLDSPVGLALTVSITRPNGDTARYRFGEAWSAEEARA